MVFHISRGGERASEKPNWRQYKQFDLNSDDEKNVYLEKTKVTYKALFMIGYMPITFTREGVVERVYWKLTSFESIYSVIILSTAFSCNMCALFSNVTRIREAEKFNDIFAALFNMFTIIPHISKIISLPLEMRRAETLIADWHKLQLKYKKVTGKNFSTLLTNFEKIVYMTHFVSLIVPIWLLSDLRFYKSITWEGVIEVIAYSYNASCSWQLAAFWYVNSHCIRRILKDLKVEINQRLLKDSRTTAKNTDDLRFLWLSLSSIIQQLGTVFAFTLMTRIFVLASILIISLYFALAPSAVVEHESFDKALRYHLKYCILFGLLFFFFNTGYIVRKSATEEFQLQLLSIRPTKEQRIAGFEFQIKVFLQSLRSFPPIVSASGFFTVTRRTYLAILSSAMTNFLIMEQFKLSERQFKMSKNQTLSTVT